MRSLPAKRRRVSLGHFLLENPKTREGACNRLALLGRTMMIFLNFLEPCIDRHLCSLDARRQFRTIRFEDSCFVVLFPLILSHSRHRASSSPIAALGASPQIWPERKATIANWSRAFYISLQ